MAGIPLGAHTHTDALLISIHDGDVRSPRRRLLHHHAGDVAQPCRRRRHMMGCIHAWGRQSRLPITKLCCFKGGVSAPPLLLLVPRCTYRVISKKSPRAARPPFPQTRRRPGMSRYCFTTSSLIWRGGSLVSYPVPCQYRYVPLFRDTRAHTHTRTHNKARAPSTRLIASLHLGTWG